MHAYQARNIIAVHSATSAGCLVGGPRGSRTHNLPVSFAAVQVTTQHVTYAKNYYYSPGGGEAPNASLRTFRLTDGVT